MTRAVELDAAALVERVRASTVQVVDVRGRGAGSGVVWSSDGTVVTNAHVVRGDRATVVFADGTRERGDVVRRDPSLDLAALRVRGGAYGVATPRTTPLRPGELVVAVGNPLGLVGAASAGIVQRATARWVVADVRLAPGNSGGPLVDAAGLVVGINSMVAGERALAIPVAQVASFLGAGEPRRLGIAVVPVALSARLGGARALLVSGVEANGRGERAGLLLGDAIVAADGRVLDADAERAVAALGGAHALEIVRAGMRRTLVLDAGSRAA